MAFTDADFVSPTINDRGRVIGTSEYDRACGKRIRSMRQQRGLSMTDVAAHVGVSYQQIQKIEKGTNRLPASRAVQMALLFGCRPTDFMPLAGDVLEESEQGILDGLTRQDNQLYTLFLSLPGDEFKKSIFDLVERFAALDSDCA